MDRKTRRLIYDSTGGKCHLCGKKLAFTNYGRAGRRGAWHADHSVAVARGGTDRLSNLLPACISCNCSKQDRPNRAIRAANGLTARPPSRDHLRLQQRTQTGAFLGGIAGLAVAGPVGIIPGIVAGSLLSHLTA